MSEVKKTINYSPQQTKAIDTTDGNVLLSAGAGSGKTEVLSERIYRLVKNGADITRFLVLTFTKAASEEMKKRIRKKILADDALKDQSSKVESSHIETFDAFALFIVKKYAHKIGVSPNISIIDQNLLTIKKIAIKDKILTYLYQENNSDFIGLISKYCTKDDSAIRDFILNICSYVEKQKDKNLFYETYFDKYFDENVLKERVEEQYSYLINALNNAIDQAQVLEDTEDVDSITNYLQSFIDECKDYDSLSLKLETFSFPGVLKKNTSDKQYRDKIKDKLNSIIKLNKSFGTSQEIIEGYISNKHYVKVLLDIVSKIEEEVDLFKKEKNCYSFEDVAYMALRVLDDDKVKDEMKNYFQYILVDEYQDTSGIQESVLEKIGNNNICMVGDVKQSIYRFRNADCTIFQNKYNLYKKPNKDGQVIDLNTSYRSRKEVVDFVNELFKGLMDPHYGPIDYKDGHIFEYGFKKYEEIIDSKEDYVPKIYRYQKEKGAPSINKEIDIIIADIINKINNKYQVYDSDSKKFRDCKFKDFAIIMDKGTHFNHLKAELTRNGIPCRLFYDEEIIDSDIAHVIKNLLILLNSSIKQTYDDKFKHAYVSIARSFLFRDKDKDIYDTVKNDTISESKIMKKITEIKEEVEYSPLAVIMETLMREFDVYHQAMRLTHFVNNTNKIILFENIAKSMDDLGYSIEDMISYIEAIKEFKLKIPYMDLDVSENSVTITTTHRSKGLEYPIVYLPYLTSSFAPKFDSSFIVNDRFGILLPITGNTDKSSVFLHLIKVKEAKEQLEEKMRLFYVAITRTRERLILIAGMGEKGFPIVLDPSNATSYISFLSYLEFVYKYGVDFDMPIGKINIKKEEYHSKDIALKNIDIPSSILEKKKASKEKDETVSESLLEFGNEIHYLLEISNYETKDTSFISNPRMRRYIDNVLRAKNFANLKNNQVLHEFSFFDELNNVSGIIDCLVLKEDHVEIIDFKLKNIDDEKYVLQLNTYRDYIKQLTNKPIELYLISAITGEVKEIE